MHLVRPLFFLALAQPTALPLDAPPWPLPAKALQARHLPLPAHRPPTRHCDGMAATLLARGSRGCTAFAPHTRSPCPIVLCLLTCSGLNEGTTTGVVTTPRALLQPSKHTAPPQPSACTAAAAGPPALHSCSRAQAQRQRGARAWCCYITRFPPRRQRPSQHPLRALAWGPLGRGAATSSILCPA